MTLPFYKYYACGHDFLCAAAPENGMEAPAAAIRLCARKHGVGAEGLLLLSPSDRGDYGIRCLTPDGAAAPPSLPALACAAKYLYDLALVNRTELCLAYPGGSRRLRVENCGGRAWGVRMDLGYPTLDGAAVPCRYRALTRARPLCFSGRDYALTALRVDKAFAVLYAAHATPPEAEALTPLLADFPQGVTVLFTRRGEAPNALEVTPLRSTLPEPCEEICSACAAAVACAISGEADFEEELSIRCPGGEYPVCLSTELHMYLTATVCEVCRGSCETAQELRNFPFCSG